MKKIAIPLYEDTVYAYFENDETNTAVEYSTLCEAIADFREQWSSYEGNDITVWFWEVMTESDNLDWPQWVVVIDDGMVVIYADEDNEDD